MNIDNILTDDYYLIALLEQYVTATKEHGEESPQAKGVKSATTSHLMTLDNDKEKINELEATKARLENIVKTYRNKDAEERLEKVKKELSTLSGVIEFNEVVAAYNKKLATT